MDEQIYKRKIHREISQCPTYTTYTKQHVCILLCAKKNLTPKILCSIHTHLCEWHSQGFLKRKGQNGAYGYISVRRMHS